MEKESYVIDYSQLSAVENSAESLKYTVLAKIRFNGENASKTGSNVLEQIDQADSVLKFRSLTAEQFSAARGGGRKRSSGMRIEDFTDSKTFMSIDPDNNELTIQINTKNLPNAALRAVLVFDNSMRLEAPITRKGRIAQVKIKNIPNRNFRIEIERK